MTSKTRKNTRTKRQKNTRTKRQKNTRKNTQTKIKRNPLELLKNDYYTYVNLKWLKKIKLPDKYNIIDEFSTLQRKIDKEIEKNIVPKL